MNINAERLDKHVIVECGMSGEFEWLSEAVTVFLPIGQVGACVSV